ncbi:galactose-binding lectin l-1-like [Paramormyrops kingsleyae]|uniref:galactose-binding lectin l-1-like n=1 Tax=Paramormyrops kingsleyae TaxID=1676925 RepID=UPI003B96DA2E
MNLTLRDMTVLQTDQMTITGIPNADAERFTINIGHGEGDVALNFNVDFNSKRVVMKTLQGGSGSHEQTLDSFPFDKGQVFKVVISFSSEKFTIKMPADTITNYTNNFGADKFRFIQVLQDLRIKGFNID